MAAETMVSSQPGTASVGRPSPGKAVWVGRILSGLVVALMLVGAGFAFGQPAMVAEAMVGKYGYPAGAVLAVGILELACALLYAIPRTAVLGALFLTAYFGGAVATHVRAAEPFFGPIVVAIVAWVGLYLREPRLRALVPFRK